MIDTQLSIFDLLEKPTPKHELPAPTLFGSKAVGPAARTAEFAAWKEAHGNFGCIRRSKGWHPTFSGPRSHGDGEHLVVMLSADLRCDHPNGSWRGRGLEPRPGVCSCVGDLLYMASCECGWEGPIRSDENTASEDSQDHLWPGWRDLPVVPAQPEDTKARTRWVEKVDDLYPAGWLRSGGPIRTSRGQIGRRHVPARTTFGGYDMAAEES